MPPAACIAAAAEITATMISIASNGGSPGSSPKAKTRISVPTPPQRPRPIPPARTPSAMNPTTSRPSIAIRTQFVALVDVDAGSGVGVAGAGAGVVAVEVVDVAPVVPPPVVVDAAGVVVEAPVVAAPELFGLKAPTATNPAPPSSAQATRI